MLLSELLEIEKQTKFNEVFSKIKDRIKKAPKDEFVEAIAYNKNLFFEERQKVFTQNNKPNDYYFWIDCFAGQIDSLKGAPYNFEEKIEKAKENELKRYEGNEYLPKIEKFLEQSDETIITKMAHVYAYREIAEIFNSDTRTIKKILNKKILKKINTLNHPDDPDLQYRELFKSEDARKLAESIIKEFLIDDDGLWGGLDGKLQEIPALMEVLKKKNYINYKHLTPTVKIFCNRYHFEIKDRTARTKKGYAYDEALIYFRKQFPDFTSES